MKYENENLIGAVEASKLIGIGHSTMAKMRVTGGGPQYIKVGRRVLYRVSDIHQWLDSKQVASTSETPDDFGF